MEQQQLVWYLDERSFVLVHLFMQCTQVLTIDVVGTIKHYLELIEVRWSDLHHGLKRYLGDHAHRVFCEKASSPALWRVACGTSTISCVRHSVETKARTTTRELVSRPVYNTFTKSYSSLLGATQWNTTADDLL